MSSGERAGWVKLFSDMRDESEDGSDCRAVAETALAALEIKRDGSQYKGDVWVWWWDYHYVDELGRVRSGWHDAYNPVPGYPGMHWANVTANKLDGITPSGDSIWVPRAKGEVYEIIVHEARHHAGYGETAVDWWMDNVAANCNVPEDELPETPSGGGGSDDPPPPVDEEEEEEEENEADVEVTCRINCTIG